MKSPLSSGGGPLRIKMKEIANFLKHVYSNSISDIASIAVAEHENNKDVLLRYLKSVRDYVDTLINKIG